MAYEALARRWRPRRFEDMLGQQHVLKALTNALDQDRLHHAYLFTGTRGVGKTTIARIFAKSLNCEEGISSQPCGKCSACTQVDEGRFLDLIEVDAASRTGVDDTRELLDNVAYAPGSGRYKVYLIDEVHMFSNSSFNALLKTLEEPPPHVKFLLATTDPQRLPVTVLSRCLQFNLKALPEQMLRPYLSTLLENEKVKFEPLAIAHVAQAADGSVRDALSLLDQAIAYGKGEINSVDVESMLGRFSPSRLYDLLEAVASNDSVQVFEKVQELATYVPDYSYVLGELLTLLHQIATHQTVGSSHDDIHDAARLKQFASSITPQDVIGLMGRRDMPFAPSQRQALEMTLIRMLAFKPYEDAVAPATGSAASVPAASQVNAPAPAAASQVAAAPPPANHSAPAKAPAVKPVKQEAAAQSEPAAEEAKLPPAKVNWKPEDWSNLVEEISISGLPRQLALNCVLHSAKGNQVHLHLDPKYDELSTPPRRERLREKMSTYAGGEIDLKVSIPSELSSQTPAQKKTQADEDKLEAARASIADDPLVADIVEKFGAEVNTGSIRPLDLEDVDGAEDADGKTS